MDNTITISVLVTMNTLAILTKNTIFQLEISDLTIHAKLKVKSVLESSKPHLQKKILVYCEVKGSHSKHGFGCQNTKKTLHFGTKTVLIIF